MATATAVDDYIEAAAPKAQPMLRELRRIVLDAAPDVTEKVSYGMPAYHLGGQPVVHFAAAKAHVAMYGLVHEDGDVPPELASYLVERSTLRFPLGSLLPTEALASALRRKAAQL